MAIMSLFLDKENVVTVSLEKNKKCILHVICNKHYFYFFIFSATVNSSRDDYLVT